MKNPNTRFRVLAISYESLAIIGLITLAAATFRTSASVQDMDSLRGLSSFVFALICVLGSVAGAFPRTCNRKTHFKHQIVSGKMIEGKEETRIAFAGHHPVCGHFDSHVLRYRDRTICAGCAGLVLGAFISLIAITVYFLFGSSVGGKEVIVFWLGFVAIFLGLLQYHLPYGGTGPVHFVVNSVFVFGAFLLLVGVNEIARNVTLSAYFLALTIYWILTRISVSGLRHRETCAACPLHCNVL